ncbi:RNA polymerase sigma factor [Robertmurraya massiliosenegalensis]|uniref:RNA polymerase sigma factor n=1 Tax=Robertmurraya TaxID=2837507 RepID=UPI0039A4600A
MDPSLLHGIKSGDKEAFRTLYNQQIDKALRVAILITKNQELAKEATQETFIRVYRNISSYDSSRPFDPWFYRILTNECNRIMKKESKISYQQDYLEGDVEDSTNKTEDFSELNEAIQSLNELYRTPIILKYLKGFSEREISTVLETNQNTIKSRLHKGRTLLRNYLNDLEDRGKKHV